MSSIEKFIADSIKTHGDRYNYSKSVYVKCSENVTIICSIHGDFVQLPRNHANGANCPKCAAEARAVSAKSRRMIKPKRMTQADLIELAKDRAAKLAKVMPIITK